MKNELDNILDSVKQYAESKLIKREWKEGQSVNYAGPVFTADEYVSAVKSILDGWLVLGDLGLKFERKFPRLMGKEYGVLTNSGSSSNLLMMAALTSKRGHNLPKGTKVLMPIAGFPTTLNPTIQMGFEPVFVDIELDTLNICLDGIEEVI